VELQINGWDNTRSTSQIVFSFFDSSGNTIAPGNITVDAATAYQQYFAGSDLAGVFGLHALFPVNGDSNRVVAALVELTNSAGTAHSAIDDMSSGLPPRFCQRRRASSSPAMTPSAIMMP